MQWKDFPKWGKWAADWAASYHANLRDLPVRAQTRPGDILNALPLSPPDAPQPIKDVIADFENIVVPGITHWQHPRFFAYFPSNAAPAAILAEQLAGAMAAQCMLWQTSPAATELEIKMVDWLRQAVGLPEGFKGVFQDTASSATLCAVLTMRERALEWTGNKEGLFGKKPLRIYASGRTHSSIDKALWVAGLGQNNLVKIPTGPGPLFAMDVDALKQAIADDRAAGFGNCVKAAAGELGDQAGFARTWPARHDKELVAHGLSLGVTGEGLQRDQHAEGRGSKRHEFL